MAKETPIIIIFEETTETIVEFECMVCEKPYQKKTHVPTDSIKDLSSMRNLGICQDCLGKAQEPEIRKKFERKIKEIQKQMKNDKDNELLLL